MLHLSSGALSSRWAGPRHAWFGYQAYSGSSRGKAVLQCRPHSESGAPGPRGCVPHLSHQGSVLEAQSTERSGAGGGSAHPRVSAWALPLQASPLGLMDKNKRLKASESDGEEYTTGGRKLCVRLHALQACGLRHEVEGKPSFQTGQGEVRTSQGPDPAHICPTLLPHSWHPPDPPSK